MPFFLMPISASFSESSRTNPDMQLGGTPLVPGVTFGAVSLVTLLLSQLGEFDICLGHEK